MFGNGAFTIHTGQSQGLSHGFPLDSWFWSLTTIRHSVHVIRGGHT